MNVLILGASGMLGHTLWKMFAQRFNTYATVHRHPEAYACHNFRISRHLLGGVAVESFDSVIHAVTVARPAVVINCIGTIKQLPTAQDPLVSIPTNALFPHRLANLCQSTGARLIHISTDCVFSGQKGNYTEEDIPDPVDLYGRTKLLGEVAAPNCLTLRTSIIGRELSTQHGLFEWFVSQRGHSVKGFERAIYTGFPTTVLAGLLGDIIEKHPTFSGLWHISSEPISKYALLSLIKEIFKLDITLVKDENFCCDRSLDSSRFREEIGYHPPTWPEMIAEMAKDSIAYETFK
ncbi:MAG: SDR family oxidoreductase [bacterium]|nr:SDR family oxidoreductase [bacterium]